MHTGRIWRRSSNTPLVRAMLAVHKFSRTRPGEECLSPIICGKRLEHLDNAILTDVGRGRLDALDWWNDKSAWEWLADAGACAPCIARREEMYVTARADFWDGLPAMFGLMPWDDLRKLRDTTIGAEVNPFMRSASFVACLIIIFPVTGQSFRRGALIARFHSTRCYKVHVNKSVISPCIIFISTCEILFLITPIHTLNYH